MFSFAFGTGTHNKGGQWLEVYYPRPLLNPALDLVSTICRVLSCSKSTQSIPLQTEQLLALADALGTIDADQAGLCRQLAASKKPRVLMLIANDGQPACVPEVYLKLHLLSHRLVRPHGLNLDGMFGLLPNVAWTTAGAVAINELPALQLAARVRGEALQVTSVDKFPKMTDYVVPSGVRIADSSRVRLGAYLGEGTTIMHEGFVNFNAGTEGPAMVEGRISAGVMIGSGSYLGGGCSTMGTLSGGGTEVISVGRDCLIGANAGLGFPLGDRCIVEAGLYVTAGTKVLLLDKDNQVVGTRKARELAGKSDLLFRRNSVTGAVECKANKTAIALNEELHTHN